MDFGRVGRETPASHLRRVSTKLYCMVSDKEREACFIRDVSTDMIPNGFSGYDEVCTLVLTSVISTDMALANVVVSINLLSGKTVCHTISTHVMQGAIPVHVILLLVNHAFRGAFTCMFERAFAPHFTAPHAPCGTRP